MAVFTIYNCGTCFDELSGAKKGEAIARGYKITAGTRAQNKLITAGPGSTLMTRRGYDPAKDPSEYEMSSLLGVYQGTGELTGALGAENQVDFNVRRVMEILRGLNPKPDTVNMAGWSRGACTCHAMANAMKRDWDLTSVKVNIFAFDPVPGPRNYTYDWLTVPSNVKNYMGIFMETDDHAVPFYVAELSFQSTETHRTLLHMPGCHSYAVEEEKGLEEVAEVGAHLMVEFLRSWKTQFDEAEELLRPDRTLLEDYAKMIQHTGKVFKRGKVDPYRFTGNHQHYFKIPNHLLSKSPYFINFHHKQIFRRMFPMVYKYFFEEHKVDTSTKLYESFMSMENEMANRFWKAGPKAGPTRILEAVEKEFYSISKRAPVTSDTMVKFDDYVGETQREFMRHMWDEKYGKMGVSSIAPIAA